MYQIHCNNLRYYQTGGKLFLNLAEYYLGIQINLLLTLT